MAASNKSTARGASARASNMPLRIWAMHATCNSSRALNTGTYELPPSVCKKPALVITMAAMGGGRTRGVGRVRGRMLIRLLDLFTIGDGTGEEYDIGELATYLNDAVLIAPSMLLAPEISWSSVDASSFEVTLTDHGRAVTARVIVDRDGAPTDFSTTDRFCYNPDEPKSLMRARWTTPIAGWEVVDGRPRPTGAQAVWHLPRGPFAYADFRLIPGSLVFNVRPGI